MVLNVALWLTNREAALTLLAGEIDLLLAGKQSGCFVVKLKGPMNGEEAQKENEEDFLDCSTWGITYHQTKNGQIQNYEWLGIDRTNKKPA